MIPTRLTNLLTFDKINMFLQVLIMKLLIMNFKAVINDMPCLNMNKRFYGHEIFITLYLMIILKILKKVFKFFEVIS